MVPIEHMFPPYMCIEMYANTGGGKVATEAAALFPLRRSTDAEMLWLFHWATAAR